MGLSLKPEQLKRYSQLARLLIKYGRSDVVREAGLRDLMDDDPIELDSDGGAEAIELATDLEEMGPTFIKMGQLLSTRVDLLPLAYTEALARLQDRVEPFGYEEVEEIIEEELGVRISKAFERLETRPIAAASLGQVHRAWLRDGRPVAVKVQRPGIRERIVQDLKAIDDIAELMERHTEVGRKYGVAEVAMEMHRSLLRELDYHQEAANLETLGENLARFRRIVVPRPVEDYSTSRVLTMDYVRGRKVTAVGPVARMEIDGRALAEELFEAYLQQILVDGIFHADPHPGNVFLTDDRRIALLDVGMVGRIAPGMQDELLRLVLSMAEGHGEEAASLLVHISERRKGFDRVRFENEVSEMVIRYQNVSAEELQIGRAMIALTRSAAENGLRVPPQLTLLGKTLLNLDQVGRTLDPKFEPNAAIRRHAAELMQQRMLRNVSPGKVLSSVLEMNEFTQRLPGRLNRVLDAVADREVEVRIRVANEKFVMDGLQKIANRIAAGAILGALIIGAAMLMQVETSFRILGYPGLAMLLFLGAVIGGFGLLVTIILHDRTDPDDRHE